MASNTIRLDLLKPDPQDVVDVTTQISDNYDKLDAAFANAPLFPDNTARDNAFNIQPFDVCYVGINKATGTLYARVLGNWLQIQDTYGVVPIFPNETARDNAFAIRKFDMCYVGPDKVNGTPYVYRNGTWLALGGGNDGPVGPGVPAGGSVGEYLTKTGALDYQTGWIKLPSPYTHLFLFGGM